MEETSNENNKEIEDDIELAMDENPEAAKILKLKRELEICRKEKDDYLSGWKRAKADYSNAEREYASRLETTSKYNETKILKELLALADGFESAFTAGPPESKWTEGIRGIQNQLIAILDSHGVKKIEAQGTEFNPVYHEAVATSIADHPEDDDRVIEVLQQGYSAGDRVLRPAKVKVAKYDK